MNAMMDKLSVADTRNSSVKGKNSAFCRLLDVLAGRYLRKSLLQKSAECVKQAEINLKSVKQRYLELDAVWSLCSEGLETESVDVQHCISSGTGAGVLGGELSAKVAMIPWTSVEERLRLCCLDLVCSKEKPCSGMESLSLAKAAQLPYVLTQEMASLEEVELQKQKYLNSSKHIQWKSLCEVIEGLGTVMELYKLTLMVESDSVAISHLQVQCQAMLGKQEVLQYQLIKAVCSEGRLKALQQLRHHVRTARRDMDEKLLLTKQSLEHYKSYGQEFVSLASQYHRITAEIDNKKWALSELGRTV